MQKKSTSKTPSTSNNPQLVARLSALVARAEKLIAEATRTGPKRAPRRAAKSAKAKQSPRRTAARSSAKKGKSTPKR